jgi:arginine decarboxylase
MASPRPGTMVQHGEELLGVQASHDLDHMQVLIDVSATGTSGYQAADWLREHCSVDMGMSDHRRVMATMSMADDEDTAGRLLDAFGAWRSAAAEFDPPPPIQLPDPAQLLLETVMLPRDAFFGDTEMVAAADVVGRVSAEQITPYPPGIPAVVPGERLDTAVIEYLRTGIEAGMNVPDPADPSLKEFRGRLRSVADSRSTRQPERPCCAPSWPVLRHRGFHRYVRRHRPG